MGSGQDFQDLIDRLAAAATDAREAVREAHAARKDLAREVKEAKATVEGLMAAQWDERVGEAIRADLTNLRVKLQEAQDIKTRQITASFDKLTNLILYGRESGRGLFIVPDGRPLVPAFKQAEAEAKAPLDGERG